MWTQAVVWTQAVMCTQAVMWNQAVVSSSAMTLKVKNFTHLINRSQPVDIMRLETNGT